ncbi:DNA-3-methyladenine glycosylase [Brevibacterium sanguinis]|uniref:Putative 3-methyladenine DNA glycosylase n=2 Tax=Brevibacterium TaxID=1696 RepID=A0A366IGR5_9MICO|nr:MULTISPECIES: DNA-3-methyladenine glycosylase [Brevibacterium]RBP63957.1 DNA-3-methyladenine glycosylase [Brevibacterium sanguinis]RBP70768.1 DNA-3-methyladenine glycosylase [Brevibacterium celere]
MTDALLTGTPDPALVDFFDRPVLDVAPLVLGAVLSRSTDAGRVAIRITEVEAYDGRTDPASHAYRGRTARNASMFGPPAHLYCYFIYGIHHSLNLVCGPTGTPTGLLVRAGEVVEGVELARSRREAKPRKHPLPDAGLARGPGCVASCFDADLSQDGAPLDGREWSLTPPAAPSADIRFGPRIGVRGEGADPQRFAWRFHLGGEPSVSARKAGNRLDLGENSSIDSTLT